MKAIFLTSFVVPLTFLLIYLFSKLFYVCKHLNVFIWCFIISIIASWIILVYTKTERVQHTILIGIISLFTLAFFLTVLTANATRSAGSDAPVKQLISSLRAEAEVYFVNEGSYDNLCSSTAVQMAKEATFRTKISCYGPVLKYFLGSKEQTISSSCNASESEYAIEGYLPSGQGYYCIDSTSYANTISKSIGTQTRCRE